MISEPRSPPLAGVPPCKLGRPSGEEARRPSGSVPAKGRGLEPATRQSLEDEIAQVCELCQELAGAGAAQCQDGERLSDLHKVHALTRRLASVMETIQNLPREDASELEPLTRGLLFEVAGLLRSYREPLRAALEAQKAPLPEPVVAYKPALHIQRTASCPPLSPGARAAGLRSLGGSQSRACDARVTPLARRPAGCLTRPPWPMPPGHACARRGTEAVDPERAIRRIAVGGCVQHPQGSGVSRQWAFPAASREPRVHGLSASLLPKAIPVQLLAPPRPAPGARGAGPGLCGPHGAAAAPVRSGPEVYSGCWQHA
mmetsp:Transcript_138320/g.385810  ORF Transcript_138320/g.385810 Transcript_138320/m.385810 type:complete len:315 (-) Transcript_138320:120-1064(-)